MQQQDAIQDVYKFQPAFDWIINPIGQIVSIDPRVPQLQIVERFCSGFNVGNGYFLTAGHCLSENQACYPLAHAYQTSNFRISFNFQYSLQKEELYPIKMVVESGSCEKGKWGNVDYAVLQLELQAQHKWGQLTLVSNPPPVGLKVITVSHPNGDPKKISFGEVKEVNNETGEINHTARIKPGSSGSPLGAILQDASQGMNGTKGVALGINVEQSVDDKNQPDHEDHYAVSIGKLVQLSRRLLEITYIQEHGFFKKIPSKNIRLNAPSEQEYNACRPGAGCCN